ncbi:MAG: hypothetical protein CMJ64_28615 [Planctomycetaceae bacterium]|nr:hypothetical protein [Planctomycetaceae bacterium]
MIANTASAEHWQRIVVTEAFIDVVRADSELSHEVAVESLQQIRDGKPAGRYLHNLVSPKNPQTVRLLVRELLEISAANNNEARTEHLRESLASVARAIRDYRAPQGTSPSPADD